MHCAERHSNLSFIVCMCGQRNLTNHQCASKKLSLIMHLSSSSTSYGGLSREKVKVVSTSDI